MTYASAIPTCAGFLYLQHGHFLNDIRICHLFSSKCFTIVPQSKAKYANFYFKQFLEQGVFLRGKITFNYIFLEILIINQLCFDNFIHSLLLSPNRHFFLSPSPLWIIPLQIHVLNSCLWYHFLAHWVYPRPRFQTCVTGFGTIHWTLVGSPVSCSRRQWGLSLPESICCSGGSNWASRVLPLSVTDWWHPGLCSPTAAVKSGVEELRHDERWPCCLPADSCILSTSTTMFSEPQTV